MARHGENIRKRKDGRWEGRYQVYDQEKQKKVYRSVYAKSYEEVRKKLEKLKTGMQLRQTAKQAGSALPEDIKLDDIARIWLEEIKEKRKPSSAFLRGVFVRYDRHFCAGTDFWSFFRKRT